MAAYATDDPIYHVDNRWLGPPGVKILNGGIRYAACWIAMALYIPVFSIVKLFGGLGLFPLAWSLVFTVGLTQVVTARINHEHTFGALVVDFINDLTAPRTSAPLVRSAVSFAGIRISEHRPTPRRRTTQKGLRHAEAA